MAITDVSQSDPGIEALKGNAKAAMEAVVARPPVARPPVAPPPGVSPSVRAAELRRAARSREALVAAWLRRLGQ